MGGGGSTGLGIIPKQTVFLLLPYSDLWELTFWIMLLWTLQVVSIFLVHTTFLQIVDSNQIFCKFVVPDNIFKIVVPDNIFKIVVPGNTFTAIGRLGRCLVEPAWLWYSLPVIQFGKETKIGLAVPINTGRFL